MTPLSWRGLYACADGARPDADVAEFTEMGVHYLYS